MTFTDIAHQRLHNQHLLSGLSSAEDVVRSLGAVQSQDFAGAKWAVGQRTKSTTDEGITDLFNAGKILRTHMLRPTWHFVAPEDIRWMQMLTAPRVHMFNKYYYKKLDLDETTLKRGCEVLAQTLRGHHYLDRKAVQLVFQKAGITASGLKLTYLIMYAELEAVVCSGPIQGKQHTLALLAERAPQAVSLSHEAALAELTRRFFTAHGPATMQDFAWWSSLTMTEVKQGLSLIKTQCETVDGKAFYFVEAANASIVSPVVHLLPNYDEYIIAYKDRRPFAQLQLDNTPTYADLSYHFVTLDGQLVGGWKRGSASKACTVELNLFKKLSSAQQKELENAAKRLESFLRLPVALC